MINGATVPDGTSLFRYVLKLLVLFRLHSVFSDSPTAIEVIDAVTSVLFPLNLVSGSVDIEDNSGGGSSDFTLDISEEIVMQGEEACVEIVASNFNNILAMQFSIEYDETALSFNDIQNINLVDLIPSSFETQILVLLPYHGRVIPIW